MFKLGWKMGLGRAMTQPSRAAVGFVHDSELGLRFVSGQVM